MIKELKKLSQVSRALHLRSMEKQAVMGALMRTAGRLGAKALAHPIKTIGLVSGGIAAGGAARATYNQMRPEVLREQVFRR